MKNELMPGVNTGKRFPLDPRTKILLTVTISTISLLGTNEGLMLYVRLLLAIIPLLLLLWSRRFRASIIYVFLFIAGFAMQQILLANTSGGLGFMGIFIFGVLVHAMPGIMMGYFLFSSTTVSEFVASMERMRVPQQIVIPMSVMFRFFPTVAEEAAAINDAMTMRGITFSNPMKMLEYRLVPMMICSVKIGEELSAAALTRGLGNPVKRTNICVVGFRIWDVFAALVCIVGWVVFFF